MQARTIDSHNLIAMDPNERLFQILQAKAHACTSNPDPKKVSEFRIFLEQQCSSEFLQSLYPYVLCPIKMIIERLDQLMIGGPVSFSTEELMMECFETFSAIFHKVVVKHGNVFEDLLTLLAFFVDEDVSASNEIKYSPKIIKISENLYLRLFECTKSLIQSCDQTVFNLIFSKIEFKAKLGYLIKCLLQLVQSKSYRVIKSKALNLITIIYFKIVDNAQLNHLLKLVSPSEECSRFVAFTLPGLSSNLMKLIQNCSNRDYHKLQSTVIIEALKLFNIVLLTVFHELQTFELSVSSKQPEEMKGWENLLTKSWLDETLQRLVPIVQNVINILLDYPDQEVRLCLLKLTTGLISDSCYELKSQLLTSCLQVPLNYSDSHSSRTFVTSNEIDTDLSKLSYTFLISFRDTLLDRFDQSTKTTSQITFVNLLHEELFTHMKNLPLLIRNGNPDSSSQILSHFDLKRSLRILIGFLNALGPDELHSFLKLEQHKYYFFRNLINAAEFNYRERSFVNCIDEINANSGSDPTSVQRAVTIKDLFCVFHFEKQMLYLVNFDVVMLYLELLHQVMRLTNEKSRHIIVDHLLQLLQNSDFDPSVALVINALISGFHQTKLPFDFYVRDLIDLYFRQLNISELYLLEDAVEKDKKDSSQVPMKLSSLWKIWSTNDDPKRPQQLKSSILLSLNKKIMRYCLALQGLTLLYTSFDDDSLKQEFYIRFLCRLLESYASKYCFVSKVAQVSLMFAAQNYASPSVEHDQWSIHRMILNNMDYIFSSFTVALDYSICFNSPNITTSSYDKHSLTTVQTSLLTIIRMLENYHRSVEALSTSHLDYLHRYVDQILNIIKFYSINPKRFNNANLFLLLQVLDAYLHLLATVFDKDYLSNNSKRLTDGCESNFFAEQICKLEKFTTTCKLLQPTSDDTVENGNESNKESSQQSNNILESPIIKSRAGNILYTSSMLLSDPNIHIRIKTLQLATLSMQLLRSYEDILLPYVHRFWDPLVKRFSSDFEHPVVMKRAFDCLMIASEFCGDFLLKRTKQEVLPRLLDFLSSRLISRILYYRKHRRVDTLKSIDYYAELELLNSLGQLAVNLKLPSIDIWKMAPILLFYLCFMGVSRELQMGALKSLVKLATEADFYSVLFYVHRFLNIYYYDHFPSDPTGPIKEESMFECTCQLIRSQTNDKHCDCLLPFDQSLLKDLIGQLTE